MGELSHQKSGVARIRVPAWIGSLLFHLVILLLLFLYFQFLPVPKSALGERNAEGGIVLAHQSQDGKSYVDSENNEYGEASPNVSDQPLQSPTLEQALAGDVSDLRDLKEMLPGIGPKTTPGQGGDVPGAAILADSLRGGSKSAGLGFEIGGKAKVRVFNTEGNGSSFVYVFDRSGSMDEFGGRPLRAAKAELIRSLGPLNQNHRFNIVFYNEKSIPWKTGIQPANDTNKTSAQKFVEGIIAGGGTRHFEPLRDAIRLKPDVIFFLTDGDENDALRPGQLQDLAQLNNRIAAGAQINVIQFGIGENRQAAFLRDLAARNRGQYIYIDVTKLH